jgi:hypothetical protein
MFISKCENDEDRKEVVRMIESKNRELQAVRIELAVQICLSYPTLYPRMKSRNLVYKSDKEMVACKVLDNLIHLEPSIKHILDFHYKRM